MDIFFIFIIFLIIVVLGYNIYIQYMEKRKQLIAKEKNNSLSIIKGTEELLSFAAYIPFTPQLLYILHNRILNEFIILNKLEPKNHIFKERIKNKKEYLNNIMNQNLDSTFNPPLNEVQAIKFLKMIKRLKKIVQNEYNKSVIPLDYYTSETKRMEEMQIKINIENAIVRIQSLQKREDFSGSIQLINKSISMLKIYNNFDYCRNKIPLLQQLLLDHEKNLQFKTNNIKDKLIEKNKDEFEAIFGDKKKW